MIPIQIGVLKILEQKMNYGRITNNQLWIDFIVDNNQIILIIKMTKVIVLNVKTSDVNSEVVQISKVDRNKVLIKQNKEVGIGIIDFEEKIKKGTKIWRLLEN